MKLKAGFIIIIAVLTAFSIISNYKAVHFYFINGYTENKAIAKNWNRLIQHTSCLTGGQDYNPEVEYYQREGSALGSSEWIGFLKSKRTLINPFLLAKIKSTRKTAVHVCPHENALEGELAVYCLQHVNRINYDQLDSNPIYRIFIAGRDNRPADEKQEREEMPRQKKLQSIIRSPKRLKKLIRNWELYISYHTSEN